LEPLTEVLILIQPAILFPETVKVIRPDVFAVAVIAVGDCRTAVLASEEIEIVAGSKVSRVIVTYPSPVLSEFEM
jgi:hypothetical protein